MSIIVQGAPSFYKCEVGVLDQLEQLLTERSIQSILVVHGMKSLKAIKTYIPQLSHVDTYFEEYNGECSQNEITRFKVKATELNVDAIVGIGGGKVLDLTKAAGHYADKDVILIPTLASTCAAWTPLSVIYDDEGKFVTYTIFPRSTYMVLVEPRVILEGPLSYFRAGIGDTLAKWYEARVLVHDLEHISVPIQVALNTAKLSREVLIRDSYQAILDCEKGELTPEVLYIIESNLLLGGMVGGFGDRYGRIAGAHSIHNALTNIPATHHLLHGEKVAYGILVQLALENDWKEVELLLPIYQQIGLPFSLAALNIEKRSDLDIIAEKTLSPNESIHFMKDSYQTQDIINAIEKLETVTKNYKKINI